MSVLVVALLLVVLGAFAVPAGEWEGLAERAAHLIRRLTRRSTP